MPRTPARTPSGDIIVNKRAAIAAAHAAEIDRGLDIFMRTKAVAADPDGQHLWLLLEPKRK